MSAAALRGFAAYPHRLGRLWGQPCFRGLPEIEDIQGSLAFQERMGYRRSFGGAQNQEPPIKKGVRHKIEDRIPFIPGKIDQGVPEEDKIIMASLKTVEEVMGIKMNMGP